MKKIKLLCTFASLSTLASSCAIVTSCSTAEVKSISVTMNSPVKYIGSRFEPSDLTVKAIYSDGTEKEIGYTSQNYQDGYDISSMKMGHELSYLDLGTKEITVVYKTFSQKVKFLVTQPIKASLVGSREIGLTNTDVNIGQTFETKLVSTSEGYINLTKVVVEGVELTSQQYTFKNDKLTIDGQYVKGGILIFASFIELGETTPMGITALSDGTFKVVLSGDEVELPNLSYSTDNGKTWTVYEEDKEISLSTGDTLLLKGLNPNGWNKHANISGSGVSSNYAYLNIACDYNLSGSLVSLLGNGELKIDTIPSSGCFGHLFQDNTGLKSIDNDFFRGLVNLSPYCYSNMFENCGLTNISGLVLPAEHTTKGCYLGMFESNKNLTNSPKALPAMDIRENCYKEMFIDCVSLKDMPELPATYLNGGGCYQSMFERCEALTSVHDLPASNSLTACYFNMFRDCKALVTAPKIFFDYATTTCCYHMFSGCKSLTTPAIMPSYKGFMESSSPDNAFKYMYHSCESLKVQRNDSSFGTKFMTISQTGVYYAAGKYYSDMFTNTAGPFYGTPEYDDEMYFSLD